VWTSPSRESGPVVVDDLVLPCPEPESSSTTLPLSTKELQLEQHHDAHIHFANHSPSLTVVDKKKRREALSDVVNTEKVEKMDRRVLCSLRPSTDLGASADNAEGTRRWPRRVTREFQQVQNEVCYPLAWLLYASLMCYQEDLRKWQLRPVSTSPSSSPSESENELQRMRAKLRPPPQMTDQQRRVRQVWSLQGTEKGQMLKEQHLRKA